MPSEVSRRNVLKSAVGTAIGATAVGALAQSAQEELPVEKELAKPLSPELRKMTGGALANVKRLTGERLKTKLPENSEPCFVFVPAEFKEKR